MTNRWIIQIEAPDGSLSYWGSWRDGNTAEHLASKLRDSQSGDGDDYGFRAVFIERWPGLRRALLEVGE